MPREIRYRNDESDEEDEVARNVVVPDTNSEGGNMTEGEPAQQNTGGEDDEEEEEDDETYEIERIVHHKKGQIAAGKMAYHVKWKGYPETDNSWVLEEDCNAPLLIKEYWDRQAKNGGKGSGKGRSSKRGRDSDVKMEEEDDLRPPKKSKKDSNDKGSSKGKLTARMSASSSNFTGGRTKFSSVNDSADQEDNESSEGTGHPQDTYSSMEEYWGEKDWSRIIKQVLTVDNSGDSSDTVVYFLELKNGQLKATTTEYMVDRAPALAIRFFEQNLRFNN